MSPLELYYSKLPKSNAEVLLACRNYLLDLDFGLTAGYKWSLPFFEWQNKNLCYFNYQTKANRSYLAFMHGKWIENTSLISEKQKQIRFLLLDPNKDLPVQDIYDCVKKGITYLERK